MHQEMKEKKRFFGVRKQFNIGESYQVVKMLYLYSQEKKIERERK